jgi:pimeloyl-ACP methyl ester carboxylesterase
LGVLEEISDPPVLVGHSAASSYAALIAAAKPCSLLIYLCPRMGGFPPPPGAPRPFRETLPFPEERPDGTSAWEPATAIAAMYGRLPPATAADLATRLRPMALPPDQFPLTTHPDVPVALVYSTDDEFFEPAWERFMASEFLGVEPVEIPGGHFPMIEDPEGLADLLDRLAEAAGGD